ncbi:S8 family serine peptidase [Pseudoalteromonas sp. T1lg65]|uniref:S8 family serine peptidase n=1 Tax=Pseudoalteromonas sp. T1lg65 TaxID=2077101 RepID=UPI003F7B11ED
MKDNCPKSKILFTSTLVTLAVSASLQAQPVTINQSEQSPLPKRYIIKYKPGNATMGNGVQQGIAPLVQSRMATMGVNKASLKPNLNVVVAELSEQQLHQLKSDNSIEYVEEDLPRHFMAQSQLYGYEMVQANLVNDYVASAAAGGKKICVIDSGLDLPHPDMGSLNGTITGTNDDGTGNWFEHGTSHGTHVAGTIAALNNGIGVRGVIGSDPSLHIIKVFNSDGWGYASELADAVNYCKEAGSDVINMSLGGGGESETERAAFQAVADAGVLIIAAAGNSGDPDQTLDRESFPASYDSVMSVAAIDENKELAFFSQKNSQVEIAAPGVNIESTYPVGAGSIVSLTVSGQEHYASGMENEGEVTAALYNFSTGENVDYGANGKVCLIERGNIPFVEKVQNCENSGGVGAIIYNNESGSFAATLGDNNQTSIPAVATTDFDGQQILTKLGYSATVKVAKSDYGMMSGTSMASPHVAGVAALVWSHHPDCSASEIRTVLNATAVDLGAPGRDVKYGHGLVQTKAAIDYISANGCSGDVVTPPTPIQLNNGETKTNLSGAKDEELLFKFDVPAGASKIKVTTSGGSGDADLYAQFGSIPTDDNFECRPLGLGNNEFCELTQSAGTYYIKLKGYSDFAGVSLQASFDVDAAAQPIDRTIKNISIPKGAWASYTVNLDGEYQDLNIAISGGNGDADLYVRRGSKSNSEQFDCRPFAVGSEESCKFNAPQSGVWHIDIYGFASTSGLQLSVKANPKD